ncbi:CASP-like protein 2C1 [Phoenix dactylifera]|uniref:CASP-like protein n=1 Tax=Phoenix dactylifera TaxID=42345 RepID=A0A8B7CIZ4_PHODC|nr:CASP-like protein 2C1 [Phoenix dactylifera]
MRMSKLLKAESLLRVLCLVLASMAAVLIGLDTQTKTVFFVRRKATVKDLEALWISTIITSIAAGYHLLQFCRCLAFAWLTKNPCWSNKFMAWASFLLDQGVTYVTFGGILAGMQASMIAVTGMRALQWEKLCNIYARFCDQVAAGLVCGIAASLSMAVVSSVSAYHLFRL